MERFEAVFHKGGASLKLVSALQLVSAESHDQESGGTPNIPSISVHQFLMMIVLD